MSAQTSDLGERGSYFKTQWLKIKSEYGKGGRKENGAQAEYEKFITKSMKGKESLYEKVNTANISEWKDQKWITVAFFENFKRLFHYHEDIEKVYGADYSNCNYLDPSELTYDQAIYQSIEMENKEKLKVHGSYLQENYLKNGLTMREAEKRREINGPNKLPEKKKTHWSIMLIQEFTSVFSLLLWAGGILAIIAFALTPDDTSNLWLAIVIWGIVVVSSLFSFMQNRKSDSIIETFKSFSNMKSTVVRDGVEKDINSSDIVVGDVYIIKIGEKVAADVRIFESNSLSVNNSGLTGESEAVKIITFCGEKGFETPLEAKNLIFFSTLCVSGSGKGVVIRIGKDTFMGKIADLANSAEGQTLSLEAELNKFIYIISIIACSLGCGFFFGAIGVGYELKTGFAFAIGIIVANVPEGLVSCLTVILALTAKKLFDRNMMVKNMKSIETLGTITCVCSDKTGTLTQNKMKVVHLWYDLKIKKVLEDQHNFRVDSDVYRTMLFNKNDPSFRYLKFASICGSSSKFKIEIPDDFMGVTLGRNKFIKENPKSTAEQIETCVLTLKEKLKPEYEKFHNANIDQRATDGDASESGILKFFEKIESIDVIRSEFPQVRVNNEDIKIPFNSDIKCAGFLRKVTDPELQKESFFWLAFKGAPDYLIKKCNRYLIEGHEHDIDEKFEESFLKANQAFALKGQRVLAVAYRKFNRVSFPENFEYKNDIGKESSDSKKEKVPNYPTSELCFVGLIALEDPPRDGVREAIAKCKKAGIKVIMITGDQTLTAASIAYQIGIIEDLKDTPEVIMAEENLDTIEEAERKSSCIIVDGIRLAKMLKLEENLSETNPTKGEFLREWLMKRDVVFARTSPDQKLIIVDGCQKLSHIVAVTGDGVNDAPALKKADIGIAMGKVGTDVAKDAADILLMDDNFSNIIKGIKQGRIIFDCLKKIISYDLATTQAELGPVIAFFAWGVPLPFTTIVILSMDAGSNIYPNISFGYERAESNIMDRPPRNKKKDTLFTFKLMSFAYFFQGVLLTLAGFLGYFACLIDYGFTQKGLIDITLVNGIIPSQGDIYKKDDPFKGNSNAYLYEHSEFLGIDGSGLLDLYNLNTRIDTNSELHNDYDLRVMLYTLENDAWGECKVDSVSYSGETKVCYSVEAIKHSVGTYFASVVMTQVANGLSYRTITSSLLEHLMDNNNLNIAFFVENLVVCCILYIPGLNQAFGVRAIVFSHWVPCLGMFVVMLLFSEFTKYLIRNIKEPDGSYGFFYRFFKY